jgi:DNA-binding transcriptional ArsR family regulator
MSLGVGAGEPDARVELRALAHPTRLQILSLLTGAALTAADVARELTLTHANASYHLRQLLAAGTIVVAGEEKIRGGAAKRYRYDAERTMSHATDPDQQHLPDRRAVYLALAAELRRRSARLRHVPKSNHVTDAELWVDPEVWDAVRAKVTEASMLLHRSAQPARTPGTLRINATMALFEMEPE